jgi:hypothetical protein
LFAFKNTNDGLKAKYESVDEMTSRIKLFVDKADYTALALQNSAIAPGFATQSYQQGSNNFNNNECINCEFIFRISNKGD